MLTTTIMDKPSSMMCSNSAKDTVDTTSEVELTQKGELLVIQDGQIRVASTEVKDDGRSDANGETIRATGTWTNEEHERFLKAIQLYPKGPWKAVAAIVGTRTVRQTQTHAQKYREKIARRMRGLRNRNGTLQNPLTASDLGHKVEHPLGYVHKRDIRPEIAHESPWIYEKHSQSLSPNAYDETAVFHAHAHQAAVPMTPVHIHALAAPVTHANSVRPPVQYNSHSVASTTLVPSPNSVAMTLPVPVVPTTRPCPLVRPEPQSLVPSVPNFDESMDFFMSIYTHNPDQLCHLCSHSVSTPFSGLISTFCVQV